MKSTIENFYQAFKNLDAESMIACYHSDVVFFDPAFGRLEGEHACNMWRMLVESQKGKDFVVTFSEVKYDDEKGKAHWEATYTFSKTGRKVHNVIEASFEFKDGMITKHTDRFDMYRWSRQAFGLTGFLMGWTPFFKKKLQAQTARLLLKFEAK